VFITSVGNYYLVKEIPQDNDWGIVKHGEDIESYKSIYSLFLFDSFDSNGLVTDEDTLRRMSVGLCREIT
jgi:hypothetical protein